MYAVCVYFCVNNSLSAAKTSVVLFSADWAEQCKQVSDVLEDLSKLLADKLQFITITAEEYPDIAMKHQVLSLLKFGFRLVLWIYLIQLAPNFQIEAVPTVIFFTNGTAVDRVDGVDIPSLSAKCKNLGAAATSEQPLEERLKNLINKAPLMIFMKGDRDAPRCGFSKQLIAIVNELG